MLELDQARRPAAIPERAWVQPSLTNRSRSMSRHLALQFLGPFTATYGGGPLRRFRTKAVRALLIYLTCRPEPHRRESLMTLLWPDATQTSAQNSLRQALYYLRKAIPETTARESDDLIPFVLSDRQFVRVNPQAAFDLDVSLFEWQLKGSQAEWQGAIKLYRGDFLCDFYLPASARFETWVLERRATLRRQVLDILDLLIASNMQEGAFPTVERFLRRQLTVDKLHDPAHLRLMQVLVHLGRRAEVLSYYESYCCLLEDELGVDPAVEIVDFIEQVRAAGPLPHTSTRSSPPVPKHNLRQQQTRIIGREKELSELRGLAAGSNRRLITIVGAGGIGKSRLALAFAERLVKEKDVADCRRFADGVFFVSLQSIRIRDEIVVAIAKAIDLPLDGAERQSLQQQLLDFLQEKHLLLILDSFEHLLNEAALLTDMLAYAPGLRLLVTSRQRLSLYGEQVYPLLGLTLPCEGANWESEDLASYASTALFLDCARRILPAYTPSLDEAYQIAKLCHLVSGMPLALELAASWIDVLSASRIASEIGKNLDFLTADIRDFPERHRSMRAVFDSTWSQLSAAEQAVLAQLSVFRGGFSARAAKAVTRADFETLTRLVHKSILQYDRQEGLFRIHELLRQYGERRLSKKQSANNEGPLECVTRHRYSSYYCTALAEWEKGLKSKRQREVLAEIGNEWDNVRAAWEGAVLNHDTDLLGQANEALALYIACHGLHKLGKELFSAAAQHLRKRLDSTTPHKSSDLLVYARLLIWHAYFCNYHGDRRQRERLADESLTILEEMQAQNIDTRLERAKVWQLISTNYRNAWRHEEALQAAKNSLALSRAVDDDWSVAGALEALGRSACYLRNYEQASEWLECGLTLQRKLGNRAGEARALRWLATVAGSQGQFARDEQLTRGCLAIHESLDNKRAAAQILGIIAIDLYVQGRSSEAITLFAEAISKSRHIGDDSLVAYQLGALASAKETLGLYDEATALAREALALIRGQNVIVVQSLALRVLCTVAIVQKRYRDAAKLLQERQDLLVGCPLGQQIGLACQSYLATANKDYTLSVRVLQAALQGSDQAAVSLLWTLPAGALVLARLGAIRQGLALYAAAAREPFVGNSRWFNDVVGAPLREMVRALPREVVQEAEEQGREWDMWDTAEKLLEELEGAGGDNTSINCS